MMMVVVIVVWSQEACLMRELGVPNKVAVQLHLEIYGKG